MDLSPVPKGFKITELGLLPEDWQDKVLGNVAELVTDKKEPSQAVALPYVGLEHIDSGDPTLKRWGDPSEVRSTKGHFQKGDVLYGKLRPYLDKAVLALWEGICSTDILILRPQQGKTTAEYLTLILHTTRFLQHAISTTTGTNHPRTSWVKISEFEAPLPPIPEQKRIAAVLLAVQQAREKTEAVIQTARALKKSIMKHLFSYGPVPVEEAEKVPLKEAEIGEVPEEWEVRPLGKMADVKGGKRLPKGHRFAKLQTGFWYIRVVDMKNGTINKSDLRALNRQDYEILKRYSISKEDVYISIAGTIGLAGTIPNDLDGAILTENAAKIVPNQRVLDNKFLSYFLSSAGAQAQIELRRTKTSQPKLALFRIKEIPVICPPISIQREIAANLKEVEKKIESEENRRKALEQLFKTLLQDLITAKIRINDLEVSA